MSYTYEFYVSTNFVGCETRELYTVEEMGFSEKEWDDLSEEKREDVLKDTYEDFLANNIDGGWHKLETKKD